MDETGQRIIDATMALIRDKGYVATTTRDIAQYAGVNECTLFRKFKNKKDIALSGIAQEKWRANITPEVFQNVKWELQEDLEMFMNAYIDRITPDFVKLSIGLRAPQLYEDAAPLIMKIPQVFLSSLTAYFEKMEQRGKLANTDFASLALTVFSSTFGYTFLKASFQQELSDIKQKEFVRNTAAVFVRGITHL